MANLRTRRPRLDPATFIAAAEEPADPEPASTTPAKIETLEEGEDGEALAWDRPGVRADVVKPFNLRLPEPLKLKLDHIRKQTRVSVHEFVMNALIPAVEAELERLRREGR